MLGLNKKALTRLIAAGSIASAVSFGSGAHAFAGTDGQQLEVYSSNAVTVFVQGTNQSGDQVGQCFNLNTIGGYSFLGGWWWIGATNVQFYSQYQCAGYISQINTTVPLNSGCSGGSCDFWTVGQP